MTWRVYEVVFRLRSPLHIGCGKVSNLQRTRPYVIGRVFWGALTMRLTRDAARGHGPATDSREYGQVAKQVHQSLSFTYFYPALKSENDYRVIWPWEDESTFRSRFLSSYQGTALAYPSQSAAEGMLHEAEFISPNTLDTGDPVFLMGYIFEKSNNQLNWQSALKRLQMGGERGYGWGDVDLVKIEKSTHDLLFGGAAIFEDDGDIPGICLKTDGRLLAHTVASDLPVAGDVEPLVGREWRSDNSRRRHVGQYVAYTDVCFTPGSIVHEALNFGVEAFGVWRRLYKG